MNQKTPAELKAYYSELPTHELIDTNPEGMSPEELRILVSVIQERRVSPQKQRASARKQSDKLTGKGKKTIDITGYI